MEKSNRLSLFNRISDFLKKHDTIVFTMVLLFVTLFAYRNYIWGEKYLVISHEGSDSINQFYPYYLYYARRIANGEIRQIYNFSEGLGKLSVFYRG